MNIPPLSQSRQKLLACPYSYAEQVIRGHKAPQSEPARRGTSIHEFLSGYVRQLIKSKRKSDVEEFDRMLRGMEPSARDILEDMREMQIDPEAVFATEQHIELGEAFQVTSKAPAYEMTLDLIEVFDEVNAKITDYKSQFATVDPDTFQARLYSLGLLMLNPRIHQVEFQLKFLRWGKERSVTFTREDIPRLQEEAANWREYQQSFHTMNPKAGTETLPGNHCLYCPLLGDGCPIEKNPATDPASLLRKVLYAQKVVKQLTPLLKEHCDKEGPLTITDGLDERYAAHWEVQERKSYGVDVLVPIQEWQNKMDDPIIPKLTISGLSSLLKAKKRADLADECANFAEVKPTPTFRIGRVGEQDEEE